MMNDQVFEFKPIGLVKSWYVTKNATPRQATVCPESRGSIELNKTFFNKPYCSLENLDEFSHIWILFYFHQNSNKKARSKIQPPRLNGKKVGLFSTRSPHRPNPIGLSLVKLDKIEGNVVHVSGIDLLDGTPVLDIKPYIRDYDYPKLDAISQIRVPDWINSKGVAYERSNEVHTTEIVNLDKEFKSLVVKDEKLKQFKVLITDRAIEQLGSFHSRNANESHNQEFLIENLSELKNFYLNCSKVLNESNAISESFSELKCRFCFQFLDSIDEARKAIENILLEDPRSSYRRTKCSDRLYYFTLDTMHITCWFDEDDKIVEVVKIKPNYL